MLVLLLFMPPLGLELPEGRPHGETQALEMDRWVPVLVLPHPGYSDLSQLLNHSGQRVFPSSVRASNTYLMLSAQNEVW